MAFVLYDRARTRKTTSWGLVRFWVLAGTSGSGSTPGSVGKFGSHVGRKGDVRHLLAGAALLIMAFAVSLMAAALQQVAVSKRTTHVEQPGAREK
jgi:hypothetical protein